MKRKINPQSRIILNRNVNNHVIDKYFRNIYLEEKSNEQEKRRLAKVQAAELKKTNKQNKKAANVEPEKPIVETSNYQKDNSCMIRLENINKYYQSGDEKIHALKNINLELPYQGLVFVLGQSGCGKSTLLNILGGLDKPEEGRILIEGADFSKFNTNQLNDYLNSYLGFVFQEYNILKDLNLYDNIALPLEMQKINKKEIKERTLEIIETVGLSELRKRKINQLSGGQRQRIAVARALIKDPRMIIADEPTGNLDSVTGATIFDLFKKLSQDRLIVIVTHDEESAYKYGDRVIRIEDGTLVEDINAPFSEFDKNELIKEAKPIEGPLARVVSKRKNEESNDSNGLVLTKVSVPVKTSFKLALKNINHKKFRFILMMLICALSLAFFSFTLELNNDKIRQNVYTSVDNNYLLANLLEKSELPDDYIKSSIYDEYIGTALPSGSYDTVRKALPDLTIHEYRDVIIPVSYDKNLMNAFYTGEIEYLTKIDSVNNYKLLAGRVPVNNNEILITDYLVSMFSHFNLYQFTDSPSDYIGRYLTLLSGSPYLIVGVIDTNYENYTHFTKLDEIDYNDKLNYAFINEYKLMNSIYLTEESFNLESSYVSVKMELGKTIADINFQSYSQLNASLYTITTDPIDVKTFNLGQDSNGNPRFEVIGRGVNPGDDVYEMVVPYSVYAKLFNRDSGEPTSYENYYRQWRGSNKSVSITVQSGSSEPITLQATIVGITQVNDHNIWVSQGIMNFIFNNVVKNSSSLLAEVSPFEATAYSQFQNAYDEGYIIDLFSYRTDIDAYEISPFVDLLSKAGLFVFAVFTIGILWTIISLDIVDSKKEIGTFRSIGLSGAKVSMIFIFQTLIICVISYIIALIAGNYAINIYNSQIYDSTNVIHLSMYMMTYRSPVFLILFLIVITSLALFLPLAKIMRQKIIDVINERGDL